MRLCAVTIMMILSLSCSKEFCDKLHRANIEVAQKMSSVWDCNPKKVMADLDKAVDITLCRRNPAHRGAGILASLPCYVATGLIVGATAVALNKRYECNIVKVGTSLGKAGGSVCSALSLL